MEFVFYVKSQANCKQNGRHVDSKTERDQKQILEIGIAKFIKISNLSSGFLSEN